MIRVLTSIALDRQCRACGISHCPLDIEHNEACNNAHDNLDGPINEHVVERGLATQVDHGCETAGL